MLSLTEFLLERVREDEAAVRGMRLPLDVTPFDPHFGPAATHPARVLAECEAKRRIVAEHEIDRTLSAYERSWGGEAFGCVVCHEFDGITCGRGYCPTLRALALPYADHPDYDESWKP